MSAIFAFLHHIAAFVLFAALVMEFVLTRGEVDLRTAQRLLRVDASFGIAAGVVLVVGVLRVIFFEKGAEYYMHSVPFILKMSLFVIVGLLSIYPTVKFMAWRPAVRKGQAPEVDAGTLKTLRRVLHIELAGAALILLFAAMMARGIWMVE